MIIGPGDIEYTPVKFDLASREPYVPLPSPITLMFLRMKELTPEEMAQQQIEREVRREQEAIEKEAGREKKQKLYALAKELGLESELKFDSDGDDIDDDDNW
mgnify:CR=1 FL=1